MKQILKQHLPLSVLDTARQLRTFLKKYIEGAGSYWFDYIMLPPLLSFAKRRLEGIIQNDSFPRIAVVKQDVNEDLYCCEPAASAKDIVGSTLLRSGPVALFSKFNADFFVVETEPDPECGVWQEKWTECRWCPLEWFEAFRDKVPGRPYGQRDFAVKAEDIDWSRYDIVISVDVAVPERITRKYRSVVWSYYVREVKTESYRKSAAAPLPGQDIFLNQNFRRWPPRVMPHVVEFPYHLQYHGCFRELFGTPSTDEEKSGVFLEHHTGRELRSGQLSELERFGPVASTALVSEERKHTLEQYEVAARTVDPEFMDKLMRSKYFLKCGGRPVLGTAMVEAVAMGCLAIGDPTRQGHGYFFNSHTAATTFEESIEKIDILEKDDRLYDREVMRQRRLVDYLCYVRPSLQLFKKAEGVLRRRNT